MTDDSLIREVDEEVRQEKFRKFWDRHGSKLIAAAAALVLGVAAYEGWSYYQKNKADHASLIYVDAVNKANDGKYDDALAAFAAINHAGFNQLADMRKAAILASQGKVDEAVAAYDALIANRNTDPALADLAKIRQGYLLVDSKTPDELLTRLGGFDKDDNPWRHAAREIFGLAAFRVKDFTMADRYMNAIFADQSAPASVKQRAQVMIQLIAPELNKK